MTGDGDGDPTSLGQLREHPDPRKIPALKGIPGEVIQILRSLHRSYSSLDELPTQVKLLSKKARKWMLKKWGEEIDKLTKEEIESLIVRV